MDREGCSSHSLNIDTFPGQSPATNQSTEGNNTVRPLYIMDTLVHVLCI